MNRIANKEKVSEIVMYPTAYTKCQIGQDWFLNRFVVYFTPNEFYPDYMEVNRFIDASIEGKEMNIEQAARALYDFLKAYEPRRLTVVDRIRDCKTHFDVDVTIE